MTLRLRATWVPLVGYRDRVRITRPAVSAKLELATGFGLGTKSVL